MKYEAELNPSKKNTAKRVYAGPEGWQSSSHAFQGCFLGQVKCVLSVEHSLNTHAKRVSVECSCQNDQR